MPSFAANVRMLFIKIPMLLQPALVRGAVFDEIKVLFSYDYFWKD